MGLSPRTTVPCWAPVLAPSPELSGGTEGNSPTDTSRAWPLLRSLQNVTTLTKPQRLNFRSRKNRKGQLRLGGKGHPGGVPPAPHLLRRHPVPPRLSLSAAQAPSPAPLPSSQTHGLRAGKSPKTAPRCGVGSEQSPGCPPGTCLHHAPLTTHPPSPGPSIGTLQAGTGPCCSSTATGRAPVPNWDSTRVAGKASSEDAWCAAQAQPHSLPEQEGWHQPGTTRHLLLPGGR